MSLVDRFGLDRFWRLPEGFLVFGVSGLLRVGSVFGSLLFRSESVSGSVDGNVSGNLGVNTSIKLHPMMGMIMNRLVVGMLVIASLMVLRGMTDSNIVLGTVLFNGIYVIDSSSQIAKAVLRLATAGCLFASGSHSMLLGLYAFEYPILMALATMGLMVMVSANDFIGRYLGLEWQSLCLYVRAAFRRGSAYSTEAGLKYFILGAVASAIYLFGASLVYGATGTLNFSEIGRVLMGSSESAILSNVDFYSNISNLSNINLDSNINLVASLGLILVLCAFMFKLAVAPFHAWAPDVYEGSPLPSTLYFAVVPKLAIVLVVARLCMGPFAELFNSVQPVRLFGAMRSRIVSAFSARVQRRLKRFRSYSAIGHVGYIFLALASGSLEGVQSAVIYILLYVVMSMTGWLSIMSLTRVTNLNGEVLASQSGGNFDQLNRVEQIENGEVKVVSGKYLTDLGNLGHLNPFLAMTITLTVRSMAGIPPLAGFFSKMWVFFAAMSQSLVFFSLTAVLISCIGAFYYRRLIKIMYFESVNPTSTSSSSSKVDLSGDVDTNAAWVLGVCVIILVGVMAFPGPLLLASHRMALSLIF